MLKFSSFYGFLALGVCAFLFFACSEEKGPPTRDEICQEGVTAECLAGHWVFNEVDNSGEALEYGDNYLYLGIEGEDYKACKDNMGYEFKASFPVWGEVEHYGCWEFSGNQITITNCSSGERCADIKEGVSTKIDFLRSNINRLKVHNGLFSGYPSDPYSPQQDPVEIYTWIHK